MNLKNGLTVLSLFDGISCGQEALKRANKKIENYYASEIDKHAIIVAKTNFPNTIHLGDVRNIRIENFKKIDLLMGGSPCTNFSSSGKRNGMTTKDKIVLDSLELYLSCKEKGYEFEGQSYLFWEYVRILREAKPKYFLLENVKMKKCWEDIITKELGVTPIEINSSLVSAQNRVRLYWTNIPNVELPKDKGIKLIDILENDKDDVYVGPSAIRGRYINKATIVGRRIDENGIRKDYNKEIELKQCLEVRKSNIDKSNCLTTVEKDNVLTCLPPGRYEDAYKKEYPFRYYTRREYERLQTLPDGYTDSISESLAKKAIGNGWTVDVISHILCNI